LVKAARIEKVVNKIARHLYWFALFIFTSISAELILLLIWSNQSFDFAVLFEVKLKEARIEWFKKNLGFPGQPIRFGFLQADFFLLLK